MDNSVEDKIPVHKLAGSVGQHPHQAAISSPVCFESTKAEEGEISVFGAEKYFNMKLDDHDDNNHASKHGVERENHADLHQMKSIRRLPGTPGNISETSWNSQSPLLQSFMRNRSESKQRNKADARSFLSGLSCTGSCSDWKSVYVNQIGKHGRSHGNKYRKEAVKVNQKFMLDRQRQRNPRHQVKDEFDSRSFEKMSVGSNREHYFVPPSVKSGVLIRQLEKEKNKAEDPRKSLEVFGSGAIKREDIAMNLERKLSMLTWDAIPNAPKVPMASRSCSQQCDDIESDGSSDLFEIENISCSSSAQQVLFTRRASDGTSSCVTPDEPSEASIEWSVVTASAADFSLASDIDEGKPAENIEAPGFKKTGRSRIANAKAKAMADKQGQRSRPSGLLGCKSHKALSVAETAYRSNEKARPSRLQQYLPSSASSSLYSSSDVAS